MQFIQKTIEKIWYKKILQHIDCSFKRAIKTNRQLTFEIRIRLYYELSGLILFASNNHLISFDQYIFIYNKLNNLL